MKNKYCRRSHISEAKLREIIRYFCKDYDASKISDLVGISRISMNRLLKKLRIRILHITEEYSPVRGEVEIDESYFGSKRVRGKRGRGAGGKVPVVGLLKRGGKVYTKIVRNCSRKELLPVIKGKVIKGSTLYTDSWRSYDGLVLNGYKHYRIRHRENEFARGNNHINGIESFWSYTKRRLRKYNGIRREYFLMHLKESEFRWNMKNEEKMYSYLLDNLKTNPL